MTVDPARLKSIFLAAAKVSDPIRRSELLDDECQGDGELRERVESLLRANGDYSPSHEPIDVTQEAQAGPQVSSGVELDATEIGVGSLLGGKYRLSDKIGTGGMGNVYMAQQLQPVQRSVAIKVVKPGMDSKEVLARFDTERQALAVMDHPNIAKVLDAGMTEQGRPYFVMELVKGIPITEFCDQQKLTPRERLELFVPVCHAIQHAHLKGVIHRDIKPSNVLVAMYDDHPVPKVIDFGIAKATGAALAENSLVTGFGMIVGTPEYMSPEQAQLNNLDIDSRSDIYSLSVLLYELLTGSTPVDRKRLGNAAVLEILRVIRDSEIPRPSQKVSKIEKSSVIASNRKTTVASLSRVMSQDLDWIVMKGLEKDRSRRYETANSLAVDIQHYLSDEPVSACPPSLSYRLTRFSRKYRRSVAIASLFLVLMVTATVVSLLQAARATRAEREIQKEQQHVLAEMKRADAQAEIAKAVSDFLQDDLLAQASPDRQARSGELSNPEIKVRTLLDRAADNLDDRFVDQPIVEAAIRFTIGNAYRDLGLLRRAEPQLQLATDLRLQHLGEKDPDTIAAIVALASLHVDQAEFRMADQQLSNAVKLAETHLGAEHPETLKAKGAIGSLYIQLASYSKARELIEQALAGWENTLGPDSPEALSSESELVHIQLELGNYHQAKDAAMAILDRSRVALGEEHPETIARDLEVANIVLKLGDYQEAEIRFREVTQKLSTFRSESHHQLLLAQGMLALSRLDQGFYAQALEEIEGLIATAQRELANDHPLVLTLQHNRGNALGKLGRFSDALEVFESIYEQRCQSLGTNDPTTLATLSMISVQQASLGQYRNAIETAKLASLRYAESLGSEHPHTLHAQAALAVRMFAAGQRVAAQQDLAGVVATTSRVLGDEHPTTLEMRYQLCFMLMQSLQFEAADAMVTDLLEKARQKLGDSHPLSLGSLILAAQVQSGAGNHQQAVRLARESLSFAPKSKSLYSVQLEGLAGLVLLHAGELKESEPLLQDCLDGLLDLGLSQDHLDVLSAKNNLAEFKTASGDHAEAERIHSEILEARRESLPANHPHIVVSLVNLANSLVAQKRMADAIELWEEATEMHTIREGEDNVTAVRLSSTLAGMCRNQYEQTKDEQWVERSHSPLHVIVTNGPQVLPATDPTPLLAAQLVARDVVTGVVSKSDGLKPAITILLGLDLSNRQPIQRVEIVELLVYALLVDEQFEQAVPWSQQLVRDYEALEVEPWKVASANSILGRALFGAKQQTERANALLLESGLELKELRDAIPVEQRYRLAYAIDWIIDSMSAQDNQDGIEQWQAEKEALVASESTDVLDEDSKGN